jgi:hypothetical protein
MIFGGMKLMTDFEELMTFNAESSEDYGEGGTPVSMDSVETMESAVSYHMMDSANDNSAQNLESLGSETTPSIANEGDSMEETLNNPLPSPPPVEPSPQSPMGTPTSENVSVDLESYMASHSEDYTDVASMNLADYEDWLFNSESEAGEVAVARIVSNFKASGYEVKPSYAAVAGATWSRINYAGEEHLDALKRVERASVAELQPLVVEIESEGMKSLVDKIRKAESFTEDYRAEIISEIREQMRAEQETLESEQETSRFEAIQKMKDYTTPIAVGGATILGIALMKLLR